MALAHRASSWRAYARELRQESALKPLFVIGEHRHGDGSRTDGGNQPRWRSWSETTSRMLGRLAAARRSSERSSGKAIASYAPAATTARSRATPRQRRRSAPADARRSAAVGLALARRFADAFAVAASAPKSATTASPSLDSSSPSSASRPAAKIAVASETSGASRARRWCGGVSIRSRSWRRICAWTRLR